MTAGVGADASGAAGETLAGRYRVGDLLGRGGMAEVRRAHDVVLDRAVAVKVLHDTVDDADRHRFTAEARIVAALSHPGLVTVLDAGITHERPFLVMELVEGETLAAALRPGPLPLARVADVGAQLAGVLAYAHAQGVVHRDVKPANVLLGPEGRVKLADFGIARLIGDTVRHTRTGTTIGTAAYLSPEQVQGHAVERATDVYSLGLVLLEAISGTRAFPGTPTESALARLHRAPELPVDLPPAWRDLLTRMTDLDPARRPTAEATARELAHLAGVTPALQADPGDPTAIQVLTGPVALAGPSRIDRAGDSLAAGAVAGWRRLSALPEHHRGAALAVVTILLLLVVAAIAGGGGQAPEQDPAPRDTPSATGEPSASTPTASTASEEPEVEAPANSEPTPEPKPKPKPKKDKPKGKAKGKKK